MSAGLATSTVTPGRTAPDASLTTPVIAACARTDEGTRTRETTPERTRSRLRMWPPDASETPLVDAVLSRLYQESNKKQRGFRRFLGTTGCDYGLVDRVRLVERERGDLDVEVVAFLGDHLIRAAHDARGRLQLAARGVLERLARPQQRLLADDAPTAHFLGMAGRVGNNPVPAQQLDVVVAFIADADRVGEKPLVVEGLGPICGERRFYFHAHVVRDGLRRRGMQRLTFVFHHRRPSLVSFGACAVFMISSDSTTAQNRTQPGWTALAIKGVSWHARPWVGKRAKRRELDWRVDGATAHLPLRRSDHAEVLRQGARPGSVGLPQEAPEGTRSLRAGRYSADQGQLSAHLRRWSNRRGLSRGRVVRPLRSTCARADHSRASDRRTRGAGISDHGSSSCESVSHVTSGFRP